MSVRLRWATVVLTVALAAAAAPAPAPAAASEVIDLPTLFGRAKDVPRAREQLANLHFAQARRAEVGGMAWPTLELTAFGVPSPTGDGAYGRIDARLVLPLYTFGKISAGKRAADEGIIGNAANVEATIGELRVDCARAFYAVQLGRDVRAMLEEGRGIIEDDLKLVAEKLAAGSPDYLETDRYRLEVLLAEIDARLSEARKVEGVGLAGVRYLAGNDVADVADVPLDAVDFALGTREQARADAMANRPEVRAARANLNAYDALLDVEKRYWLPDFALVGQFSVSEIYEPTEDGTTFFPDNLEDLNYAAGFVLHWTLEPGVRAARVKKARAERERAESTLDYARRGVQQQADQAWVEARDAYDRLVARQKGERAARAWLVATAQADIVGLVDAREVQDSLMNWFGMRGARLWATWEWNVAVVNLARMTGRPVDVTVVKEMD